MSGCWNEDDESANDAEELRVRHAALDSFHRYRRTAHYNVTHRRRQNFYALPQAHQQLLSRPPFSILEKFDRVDDAIEANAVIATRILRSFLEASGLDPESSEDNEEKQWKGKAKSADVDKARSTIRQFYRDWSAEGAAEREACYGPVLRELEALYSDDDDDDGKRRREDVQVLVPGSGLGRLLVEICALGFAVEGNEISYHQLMASLWMLNDTRPGETFDLHPWVFSFSNQLSREHQLRSVKIPDVHPGTYLDGRSEGRSTHAFKRLGTCAADFCTHYAGPKLRRSFDAVVTVYFVDTAPNLIRYVEAIRNTLVPDGYWINLGPLLWHFEDRAPGSPGEAKAADGSGDGDDSMSGGDRGIDEAGSVELTAEEVQSLVKHMGFEILKYQVSEAPQGYIRDTSSMMQTSYNVLFFVARRVNDEPYQATAE